MNIYRMQVIDTIFYIAILIMSVVIHEVAHGAMAYRFGDMTARLAGRLTLNPIKHLDPIGSIILPALLVISQAGFVIGWAKPVPYNPLNLTNRRWGTLAVASAGIIANFAIAIVFSVIIRITLNSGLASEPLIFVLSTIVLVNIVLAFFNLMPVPPLDGSKILFSLLPTKFAHYEALLERYGLVFAILLVFFVWQYITPVVIKLFTLLTGLSF